MDGFKNLGWAEQGLKFLNPAYASPGQPHVPIYGEAKMKMKHSGNRPGNRLRGGGGSWTSRGTKNQ